MLPLMFSSTSLIIVNNSSSVGACPMASSTCLNSHTSIVPLRSLSNARKASLPVMWAKRRSSWWVLRAKRDKTINSLSDLQLSISSWLMPMMGKLVWVLFRSLSLQKKDVCLALSLLFDFFLKERWWNFKEKHSSHIWHLFLLSPCSHSWHAQHSHRNLILHPLAITPYVRLLSYFRRFQEEDVFYLLTN